MISLSTALSGMSAANERLRASAHNVANLQTEGFKRETVELTSLAGGGVGAKSRTEENPGVSETTEMVEQKSATYAFVANLRVLQTQVRAEGALLDIQA
ncbi:flagellar basal body protein [Pelomonas sp. SE-A7]|uniref:flagellar basal body protein n=1 Tax=Pelomonas sp. SE-A7 TaxID=3054953 RepID=UPI00259D0876|nr:flagellar basal body protein [Pelomonas sp. SE-A7]MDM4764923.1 flagellar basal body protein [Pelomonas sp. SE-A7]